MNNSIMRYMVIDDEPIAHRIIEDYCNGLPHLLLVNHSHDALAAMQFLATNTVDIIFLDLNMPKLKGFDFLRTLQTKPQIIVTTAYQEFALEGFELNVCDYLLKPFSFERFLKAVSKASSNINLTKIKDEPNSGQKFVSQSAEPKQQRIFVKGDKVQHQVNIADINYIEACGNYCLLFFLDKKIITHQKISQFETDLPETHFIRVHKSYIVAKDKIESVTASHINMIGKVIPIGQTYKSIVTNLFN